MFAVIFEVQPKAEQWDAYLGVARMLRPELEQMDGFIDNVRYRSLTRAGWIFSLSTWRDEKALVRWRIRQKHHEAQEQGRQSIMRDYHLRIGEVTADTAPPAGHDLRDQRLDETEAGDGTAVTLVDARRPADWVAAAGADAVATALGLDRRAKGLVAWDVFDAVLTPGDVILLATWRDPGAAPATAPDGARRRQVRVIRDYGMYDRREAPQYYPEAPPPKAYGSGP